MHKMTQPQISTALTEDSVTKNQFSCFASPENQLVL
jgi:hypothetical protein